MTMLPWTRTIPLLALLAAFAVSLGAQLAIAQDAPGAAPPPPTPGVTAMGLMVDAFDSPTFVFILKAFFTVGLVAGLTEGYRRRLKALQDDSDRAAVVLMTVAAGIGTFLGLMGLAPPVPAFAGWPTVQTALGGLTSGILTTAGVAYLKKLIGMREEKASAPRPGFARLGAVVLVLAVSTVALAGLPLPFGSTTKLTLAAATATKCPTSPTVGRDGLVICNKDTASIWWGFGTSASSGSLTNTSTNGNELEAGDCVAIDVGYLTSATNDWTWCYSVAGTAASAVVIRETGVGVR